MEDLEFFASAQVTRDHQQYLLSYCGGGGGGGGLCTTQNAPVVEWYRHVLGGNL